MQKTTTVYVKGFGYTLVSEIVDGDAVVSRDESEHVCPTLDATAEALVAIDIDTVYLVARGSTRSTDLLLFKKGDK